MCVLCVMCVCVKVCRGVGESRLSCGFIRNCYRRACCIRSELCCTQSSIFISAARGWFYWVSADPLALQPIRPVCPPSFPFGVQLIASHAVLFLAVACRCCCLPACLRCGCCHLPFSILLLTFCTVGVGGFAASALLSVELKT